MEYRRTAQPADSAEPDPARPLDQRRGLDGRLATPVIAIVAVVCCAGPLLLGVIAAGGAGAWLAAHGYAIGAAALVAVGVLLAWRIRARTSQG